MGKVWFVLGMPIALRYLKWELEKRKKSDCLAYRIHRGETRKGK